MGIGAGLFLIALGAIFAFAVETDLKAIDLNVVGYILMAVGLVGILLSVLYWGPRKRNASTGETSYDDPTAPPPPV